MVQQLMSVMIGKHDRLFPKDAELQSKPQDGMSNNNNDLQKKAVMGQLQNKENNNTKDSPVRRCSWDKPESPQMDPPQLCQAAKPTAPGIASTSWMSLEAPLSWSKRILPSTRAVGLSPMGPSAAVMLKDSRKPRPPPMGAYRPEGPLP